MKAFLVILGYLYTLCGGIAVLFTLFLAGANLILVFLLIFGPGIAGFIGGFRLLDLDARCRLPLSVAGLLLIVASACLDLNPFERKSGIILGILGGVTLGIAHLPATVRHLSATPMRDRP